MSLKQDALAIATAAIRGALPYENTLRQLKALQIEGSPTVFAVGKAAVPMARAAAEAFGPRLKAGLLVTKYDHLGDFSAPGFECIEAAHPVADENSILAAEKAMALAQSLTAADTALFLLSGGGSAVLEKSAVPPETQRRVTRKLLSRGAQIEEINAVRKRLSLVKGGKLGALCAPAKVITLALSDVISNDKGAIASGLTTPDTAPDEAVLAVAERYLYDEPDIFPFLKSAGAPKVNDGGYFFVGDIRMLREAAKQKAVSLGYETVVSETPLTGEAREQAARLLSQPPVLPGKRAYLFAGETTVTLKGTGRGGRNQEMALSAAIALRGREQICFLSVGSDGTDGPTDAAGGYADGFTCARMQAAGLSPEAMLENNDSYPALKAAGDLIITGATGTNVNDITMILTAFE